MDRQIEVSVQPIASVADTEQLPQHMFAMGEKCCTLVRQCQRRGGWSFIEDGTANV